MARITALLSWYDETPAWLTRCIHSLNHLPTSHLIAIDGAYQLYPNAQAQSHPHQHQAIKHAAQAIGIPHHIHAPTQPWAGEVEKRNHLFELAEQTNADWYLVIDADEHITAAPTYDHVHHQLDNTTFDVAAVTLTEPGHPLGTITYPTHPRLFRAIPGLRAVKDHFTYTTPDERKLWGDAKRARLEPRHDLTAIVIEHHKQFRHRDRREAANTYYTLRDNLGIEELPDHRPLLANASPTHDHTMRLDPNA
jgi:hypothetical protein